jgi:hypothetical protein
MRSPSDLPDADELELVASLWAQVTLHGAIIGAVAIQQLTERLI